MFTSDEMAGPGDGSADDYLVGALTDEVDRLRRLVDSSWDMQAVFDESGDILDVSAASRRLFGWSRRDLVGTSLFAAVHPDDVAEVIHIFERVLTGENPVPVCFRFRVSEGSYRWVEVVAVAVHELEAIDPDDRRDAGSSTRREVQWTVRDVHERLEMEHRLRASDERFQAAMRSMAIGIVVLDPARSILEANEAFATLFGEMVDDLVGRPFDDLVETGRSTDEDHLRAQLDRGEVESYHVERRCRRGDGSLFPGEIEVSAIRGADGQVATYVALLRDVTGRVVARSLEQAAARHHRNELLGRVAGGVAHHCNNLLAVIRLEVEMARDEGGLVPSTVLHLAAISDAVDRAAVFARELLLFSGQGERNVTDVDLRTVVSRSSALLQHTPDSTIQVITELDAGPCIVSADERELESVVFALVLNAIAAVQEDGHVRIEVSARPRSGGPAELSPDVADWVLLRVSDDGAGMNEVLRARAFEPFFTTRPDGSGMGLAVVERTADDAGGLVELRSEPNRGTVVDVWLPAAGAVRSQPPPAELDVLVVDDQPEILELAARVLERAGHRVRRCPSGDEALGLIADGSLDVLVTDLVMPGTSGQELIAALREERPSVGVVVITGFAGDSDRSLPDDAQVVSKPFRSSELLEAVRRVVPAGSGRHD